MIIQRKEKGEPIVVHDEARSEEVYVQITRTQPDMDTIWVDYYGHELMFMKNSAGVWRCKTPGTRYRRMVLRNVTKVVVEKTIL